MNPSPIPVQLSQSSLSDYQTCPRRFELRYIQGLYWPAVEAEPVREVERLARLGRDFHRLVQQHLAGLPVDALTASLSGAEPELQGWWKAYLAYRPALDEAVLYPELTLSAPLNGHRLVARLDLLAVLPGNRLLVVDWKTALHPPDRDTLARRVQTRLYLYVVARAAGPYCPTRPIDPAAVQMMYWYPAAPRSPVVFEYSPARFQADEQFLSGLITNIQEAAASATFPQTTDTRACAACSYRSLCNRGLQAGPVSELDADPADMFDLPVLDW
ncbi:MAG: PD-(D/E)XK nuclease family protein, partial [Chloroflexi bacterium]